jgi:hypothetical protein
VESSLQDTAGISKTQKHGYLAPPLAAGEFGRKAEQFPPLNSYAHEKSPHHIGSYALAGNSPAPMRGEGLLNGFILRRDCIVDKLPRHFSIGQSSFGSKTQIGKSGCGKPWS